MFNSYFYFKCFPLAFTLLSRVPAAQGMMLHFIALVYILLFSRFWIFPLCLHQHSSSACRERRHISFFFFFDVAVHSAYENNNVCPSFSIFFGKKNSKKFPPVLTACLTQKAWCCGSWRLSKWCCLFWCCLPLFIFRFNLFWLLILIFFSCWLWQYSSRACCERHDVAVRDVCQNNIVRPFLLLKKKKFQYSSRACCERHDVAVHGACCAAVPCWYGIVWCRWCCCCARWCRRRCVMCIYVYVHIYTYMCIYIHMCVHIYIYVSIYIYV